MTLHRISIAVFDMTAANVAIEEAPKRKKSK
jgi:hypothetical protein